jgi:hypothetical protein
VRDFHCSFSAGKIHLIACPAAAAWQTRHLKLSFALHAFAVLSFRLAIRFCPAAWHRDRTGFRRPRDAVKRIE